MLAPKILLLCATAVAVSDAAITGAIIASYFDPGSGNWGKLNDAIRNSGRASSMYAILNSNNGIVGGTSSSWQKVAKDVHSAGGKVLVYVNTCNVSKDTIKNGFSSCDSSKQGGGKPSDVASYVQNWINYLGGSGNIDGVFLDDTPTSRNTGNVANIAKEIRKLSGMSNAFIAANQGENATPSSDVLKSGVVDVSVQQEDSSSPKSSNVDSSKKAAAILYKVSSDNVKSWAKQAGSKGYGYFYATATGSYGDLPSYIGDLLKCIGNGSCAS